MGSVVDQYRGLFDVGLCTEREMGSCQRILSRGMTCLFLCLEKLTLAAVLDQRLGMRWGWDGGEQEDPGSQLLGHYYGVQKEIELAQEMVTWIVVATMLEVKSDQVLDLLGVRTIGIS